MYTGSSDHTARAWVTEFGDCTRVFKGHKHTVSVIKVKDGLGMYSLLQLVIIIIIVLRLRSSTQLRMSLIIFKKNTYDILIIPEL